MQRTVDNILVEGSNDNRMQPTESKDMQIINEWHEILLLNLLLHKHNDKDANVCIGSKGKLIDDLFPN